MSLDLEMLNRYNVGELEARRARDWWHELPNEYKGSVTIWVLLAVFAEHERKERRERSLDVAG
jgi:hypothetical protein